MKIEKRKFTIPEQVYEKDIYIARDGSEFYSQKELTKHEEILDLEECIKDIPTTNVDILDTLESGIAYYIKNEKEFSLISKYLLKIYPQGCVSHGKWFFDKPNWYIFYVESGGSNYPDEYFCFTLDYYKDLYKSFIEQFK